MSTGMSAPSFGIADALKEYKLHPFHVEGQQEGDWVVLVTCAKWFVPLTHPNPKAPIPRHRC